MPRRTLWRSIYRCVFRQTCSSKMNDAPAALAPHRALVWRLAMNRLGRLIFQPFDDIVDVATGARHQQMGVSRLDRNGVQTSNPIPPRNAQASRRRSLACTPSIWSVGISAAPAPSVAASRLPHAACAARYNQAPRPKPPTNAHVHRPAARVRSRISRCGNQSFVPCPRWYFRTCPKCHQSTIAVFCKKPRPVVAGPQNHGPPTQKIEKCPRPPVAAFWPTIDGVEIRPAPGS